MKCFNDKNGHQWTIDINVGSARRVKAECNVDLVNVITSDEDGLTADTLEKITGDPFTLVSVLYSLCKKQAESECVSDDAFAELFDSDSVESAVNALVEEIINFSRPSKRKMLSLIYRKSRELEEKAANAMDSMMKDESFQKDLDEKLNRLFMNAQE